ncbi:MAG: hypothetical protein IKQ57_02870 [Candidatus Methanomethylophilaceae archaeon]|nr:hypothetical protein [Candidatus Methanomethylophilaceae archaeon]
MDRNLILVNYSGAAFRSDSRPRTVARAFYVHDSVRVSENVTEPDGYAYVAVALDPIVCALAILALVHHGRCPGWD